MTDPKRVEGTTLAAISIRNPVFAWMLMAGLIFFGLICFFRLGVSQTPDVDFPVVNVSVAWEGAAPEVMELDVVDVVEEAIMSVEGVRSIQSNSMQGTANITVEFELDRNIDSAQQDVESRIAQAASRLPLDIEAPVVRKVNPEDQPILWIAVSGDGSMALHELMAYTRDVVKNRFSTIAGVGEVFLGGYVEPNLRVWVRSEDLRRYQLSVNDVISAIENEHREMPAGFISNKEKEFNVRVLGEARSPEEFGKIIINSRGGAPNYVPITLDKVARIEEGLAEVRRVSRFKGRPAIGLGIRKQRGANAVAVATEVKKRLEQVKKEMPKGINLDLNFDSTHFIEEAVGELNFTLILSAILTSLVCYLFLGSWSSTFNVLLAIPTSVIGAFIGLYFFGFTLNTFTLLGLSLAIGIVVDDAIMVLENIVRHAEMGKDKVRASADGAKEITFAAVAATVAIVAIFLPVAFMKGVIGKFFFEFGVTMTIAVALSLLEALTLTPMRCSEMLKVGAHNTSRVGQWMDRLMRWCEEKYKTGLTMALNHRKLVLVGSTLVFILSLIVIKPLRKELMPPQDQSLFLVQVRTEVGSSLSFTDEKMKMVEDYFSKRSDVERFFSSVGGFGGGRVNTSMMFVTLKPKNERKLSQQEIMDESRGVLTKMLPGVKIAFQDLSMRGMQASRGFPVEFTIQGPEWDKLAQYSEEIMKKMQETGLVSDIDSNYNIGQPEVQIIPNRERAAMRGVSVAAIGQTVNAMIGGVRVGRYAKGGHRNDIRVRLEGIQKGDEKDIQKLYVRNNRGELIALRELVTIQEKPTLQNISRWNKERSINIFANLKAGKSQQDALQMAERVSRQTLPTGYGVVMTGSAETFRETGQSLIFALVVGLLVSYMVLASQFNSFIHPVTVLLALPFAISGALFSLLITNQSLNMFSFIGIILLMGIVKKNSILLVDFANQKREEGIGPREAIIDAGLKRLRPILMTSFATIAGAIPPALAIGPGAETRIPMAVTIIGGVFLSTLLTLFVVPAAYQIFARRERS